MSELFQILSHSNFQFNRGPVSSRWGFQRLIPSIKPKEVLALDYSFDAWKLQTCKQTFFSRTQIIISRTGVTVLKEICGGKVCTVTSPLHATLNFITLVTSRRSQRLKWPTLSPGSACKSKISGLGFRGPSSERNYGAVLICIFWTIEDKHRIMHSFNMGKGPIFDIADKSLQHCVTSV